jgi:hypothetical protein
MVLATQVGFQLGCPMLRPQPRSSLPHFVALDAKCICNPIEDVD